MGPRGRAEGEAQRRAWLMGSARLAAATWYIVVIISGSSSTSSAVVALLSFPALSPKDARTGATFILIKAMLRKITNIY